MWVYVRDADFWYNLPNYQFEWHKVENLGGIDAWPQGSIRADSRHAGPVYCWATSTKK